MPKVVGDSKSMGKVQFLRRGTRVTITTGRYAGKTGTVDANVFQKTEDYPNAYAAAFHVVLNTGRVVTVRCDQVSAQPAALKPETPDHTRRRS